MLKLEHKMLSANQIASFFDQNYISWTNWGSFMIIYILMEKKRRPAKVCQNLYKIPRGVVLTVWWIMCFSIEPRIIDWGIPNQL